MTRGGGCLYCGGEAFDAGRGAIASFWPLADDFRFCPRERTSSRPIGTSMRVPARRAGTPGEP